MKATASSVGAFGPIGSGLDAIGDGLVAVEIEAVGDESGGAALAGRRLQGVFDDGMAAGYGFEDGFVDELRAAVVADGGEVGEADQHVGFGYDGGAAADAARGFKDGGSELGEELLLQVDGALVGGEDADFVVLELGGGEALGVDEGLLALVVGGGEG